MALVEEERGVREVVVTILEWGWSWRSFERERERFTKSKEKVRERVVRG